MWDRDNFPSRLKSALERFDRNEIVEICDMLVAQLNGNTTLPSEAFAKSVLKDLCGKRCFDQLRRVGDAFIQNGLKTPTIRKLYAQSLLDQGELSAAIKYLEALVADIDKNPDHESELAEARGLLGRAYKQIYVNIGDSTSQRAAIVLNRAIHGYLEVYESNPKEHTWHGINVAALLSRAGEDQIKIRDIDNPEQKCHQIAEDVLKHISSLWESYSANMWQMASAMEACVALGRYEDATMWLERYVSQPKSDAFEMGSTLRQMEEIWRLDVESEPGARILPLLRGELLQKKDGSIAIDTKSFRPGALALKSSGDLEKIFGSVRYHSYQFILRSIECARAVARIEHAPGQGYGTGFVVLAEDLHECLGKGLVLITNAHVVSNNPEVKDALFPEEASVTFQLLADEGKAKQEYAIDKVVWTSPPDTLDTTILRLDGEIEHVKPLLLHPRLPVPDGEQRVYIIGHPEGGALSFSIQDNRLLDHDAPYLHYRAPTSGGSSGSPVLNAQLKLIGLHHKGGYQMRRLHNQKGFYEANEGIWIQSVKKALDSHFNDSEY